MKAFQNDIARFEELNVQVLGVSGDSLETHRDFAEELGLSFPLLVDDGSIRKHYGSGRITHLIDRDGIVRYVHKGMPDNETLSAGNRQAVKLLIEFGDTALSCPGIICAVIRIPAWPFYVPCPTGSHQRCRLT